MSEERLEIIKENVYMRSEIAKISRIGIDTSLKEELELIEEIDRLNNIINGQQKRIDKTIEAIDEILVYNDLTDTTSAFGNASRELKFYLSECETLKENK